MPLGEKRIIDMHVPHFLMQDLHRWALREGDCPGLEELQSILPGPPSPCRTRFSDVDFCSVEITWEVYFKRSTGDAWMEYLGVTVLTPNLSNHGRILCEGMII